MSIDKSLSQHYEMQGGVKNFLGKQKMVKAPKYWLSKPGHVKAKLAYITDEEEQILIDKNLYGSLRGRPNKGPAGLPSLQGGDFGAGGGGGSSGGGGGGGEGRPHGGWSAPAPAPRPAPSPHRDPTPAPESDRQDRARQQAEVEKAPTPTFDYEGEAYVTPDTIASLTPGPSPHGNRDANIAEQEKLNIQQLIAKQQEEKFGPGADPTKFGETISPLDVVMSKPESEWTTDDKLVIEEWEKDQDWDKVKELADRGESFEDIQSAMDKGLLMKQDAIRRQGLIERGLAAIMPKTKLESGLLSNIKSKFDPRSMIGNIAKNFALRKLGLGWLNPLLGIASLFGIPQRIRTARQKPTFDPAKARQLGLYADRVPTGTTQFAKRVGDRKTTPEKIVSGEVDLAKLISGDNRTLVAGLKDMSTKQIVEFKKLDMLDKMNKSGVGEPLSDEDKEKLEKLRKLKDSKVTGSTGTVVAAYGGRVDKPLTGRSRDI